MGLPFTHQNYGFCKSVYPFTAKTEFIKAHESTGERHWALAASLHCVLKPAILYALFTKMFIKI